MDKMIYLAMAGTSQALELQTARANNLANVNTIGFRADLVGSTTFNVPGEGFQDGSSIVGGLLGNDFRAGKFIPTGGPLDVAIADQGWFVLQTPDGGEAFTRAGNFKIDANGVLTSAGGLPVLGSAGVINIPQADAIMIGQDGTISVLPFGSSPGASIVIDQLKLVNPPLAQLEKGVDSFFHFKGAQSSEIDPKVTVISGGVEGSNVDAIQEMVSMISSARLYEAQMNMMRAAQENDENAAQILQ